MYQDFTDISQGYPDIEHQSIIDVYRVNKTQMRKKKLSKYKLVIRKDGIILTEIKLGVNYCHE